MKAIKMFLRQTNEDYMHVRVNLNIFPRAIYQILGTVNDARNVLLCY